MTRIKICGITNYNDARIAVESGADAIGFVFAESPRQIAPEDARAIMSELGPFVSGVGVFVNAPIVQIKRTLELTGCSIVQLHGDEPPEYVDALSPHQIIKAFRVAKTIDVNKTNRYKGISAILLDTYVTGRVGGTGRSFDIGLARDIVQRGWRVILAGGLNPDNVGDAISIVRPYGVDVSTGVEATPGRKDHEKVARFIAAVRAADCASS